MSTHRSSDGSEPPAAASPAGAPLAEPAAHDAADGADLTAATVNIAPKRLAAAEAAAEAAAAGLLERGTCVDRYVVVDRLGEGGMGIVYKAFDPELGRTVALKLLRTHTANSAEQRERLLREAQALARLSHPNVVAVHDAGTFGRDVFVAMEYIEGQTLKQWLETAPRRAREIVAAFAAAGAGLAAAHRADLVNRDFKPDNVIVGVDGRVRVLDFGLARTGTGPSSGSHALESPPEPSARSSTLTTSSASDAPTTPPSAGDAAAALSAPLSAPLTHAGQIMGTPRFMAPEQHRDMAVDERADQFSFCVSLYWALYRAFPFSGRTIAELRENVLAGRIDEPPPGAHVPAWLRRVLLRGLTVDPAARWPSMEALLVQLARDPARTARRVALATAAVIAIASLAVVAVRDKQATQHLCAGGAERLVGAWDPARKTAMRAAFVRTGLVYADAAFARTSATLDGYARDHAAMHRGACEATHVRHEQSEELLDLRMECLERRRQELAALADLLTTADADLVERASRAAASLTPLATCADTVALRAPVPLPRDPAGLARVRALQQHNARGTALHRASRYKEGLAYMTPVVAGLGDLGHAPSEAQALFLLGHFQYRAGDHAAAEATQRRAYLTATRGRDDHVATTAVLGLINTLLELSPTSSEAPFLAQLAQALVDRPGNADPSLRINVETALSAIAYGRNDYVGAKTHDERRLALAERLLGPEDPAVANALGDLAVDEIQLGNDARGVELSRRALDIEEKSLGPEHPNLGWKLVNLSAAYLRLDRVEDALAAAERAERLLRNASLASSPWLGMAQVNLGECLDLLGRSDEAVAMWQQALTAQTAPDTIATLLANLGHHHIRQGRFAEAVPQLDRALTLSEQAYGPSHRDLAVPLVGIGLAHLGLGRLDRAQAALDRTLTLTDLSPRMRGRVTLARALVLAARRPLDTATVRALMSAARTDLALTPRTTARELRTIDDWLAANPAPASATAASDPAAPAPPPR